MYAVIRSTFLFILATCLLVPCQMQGTCPQTSPERLSPGNGASNVPNPVHFEWQPVSGASQYVLLVRSTGSNLWQPNGPITTTFADIALPDFPTNWEWYVEAGNPQEFCPPVPPPGNEQPWTFSTGGDQPGCPGTTLLNPPDGAIAPPFVFFEWSPVPGASGYEIYISTNGGPFELSGDTRLPGIGLALSPGETRWRVNTLSSGCPSTPSAATFLLHVEEKGVGCDEATAMTVLPEPGTTVPSPVTFEWTPVEGAAAYVIWASFGGQPFAPVGETTDDTTLTVPLPSGPVEWFVESHKPDCPPRQSPPSPFMVEGAGNCDAIIGPTLLSPANGEPAVQSPVTFSWTPVEGAVGYRIAASIKSEPPGEIGFTDGTSLERPMPEGKIEWWVEAITEGCEPTTSEHATFISQGEGVCPQAGPSLMSPTPDEVTRSLIRFQWSEIGPETIYRLWLEHVERPDETRVLAETFRSEFETFLPPGDYAWWIEAIHPGCPPAVSERSSFSVADATNCELTPPQNLTPEDQSSTATSPVTFTWTAVSGAVAYEVWVREELGIENPIGATDDLSFDVHLAPGHWSWFVQAFVEGCEPVRSSATSFTITRIEGCDAPPPFLVHPPTGDDVVMSMHVMFEWTPSPGAETYEVFASVEGSEPVLLTTTSGTFFETQVPEGEILWHVVATRTGCPPLRSGTARFRVRKDQSTCEPPRKPRAGAVPRAVSGTQYLVAWEAVPFAASYEIQESSSETFSTVKTKSSTRLSSAFTNTVTQATPYYYRVRAISDCDAPASVFSNVVRVVVEPDDRTIDVPLDSVEQIGNTGQHVRSVFVPGGSASQPFTASTSQAWMTISPSNGTLPPEGTTLTITVDLSKLPPGASTGQVVISKGSSGKTTSNGSSSVPVTVSLVSPVSSTTKSSVKPDSVIIPAVGHASGFNSQWQSDIRITNITSQSLIYQLFFTPSGTAGTGTVKKASVTIGPGLTIAFNDILKSWYGVGAAGENATGSLEIRPESETSSSSASLASTVASSRTYNLSASGTFGQFIPGVVFANFVSKGTKLSLQQLAQSNDYRTNIGVVEGSGGAATVRFTAFDAKGAQLDQWSENLQAGEHRQFDGVLGQRGITTDNARVEIEVTSEKGKITAYASKVDNLTGDPELITPVVIAGLSESKIVLSGVGDFDNGIASWRTDLRIFNGESSSVPATLTYYPQGDPTGPSTMSVELSAGEVLEMNDLLRSHFGLSNLNGALHVTTASPAAIVATARTYNKTSSGTYGQFIPGVPSRRGVSLGGRTLQLPQIEHSPQFRTNLGLVEMSGKDVTVEVTAIVPGALAAPSKRYSLRANEFTQISPILPDLGVNEAYNARLTIRVVSGTGSINAYASVVDMSTQDPTYVPAQ